MNGGKALLYSRVRYRAEEEEKFFGGCGTACKKERFSGRKALEAGETGLH